MSTKISIPSVNLALEKLNEDLEAKNRSQIQPAVAKKIHKETTLIQLPKSDAPWLRKQG
jgi:hypothetical protein